MIEWDGGPIIVQGTNIHGRTCYGGAYIIPYYNCNSIRKEHVVYAKYNKSWILIKTAMYNPYKYKYYIINKRFKEHEKPEIILSKFTDSFNDSISLVRYMQIHHIIDTDMQTHQE